MKAEEKTPVWDLYQEYMTFKIYWNSYTPEEREIIINDFQKKLHELG